MLGWRFRVITCGRRSNPVAPATGFVASGTQVRHPGTDGQGMVLPSPVPTDVAAATSTGLEARPVDHDAPVRPVLRRRHGVRMSCARCEVAWTGSAESSCWFCDGPGVPGPPPSIYPDIT